MGKLINYNIKKVNFKFSRNVEKIIDNLAIPKGSLGTLHSIAKQIACINNNTNPRFEKCCLVVHAGDHGITRRNVSAYEYQITHSNVLNILNGGAAISVFSKYNDVNLFVVDCGINSPKLISTEHENVKYYDRKVNYGTNDCSETKAMEKNEVILGIDNCYKLIKGLILSFDAIGIGEMGIGNSSIASLLTAKLLNIKLEKVTGPGAGLNTIGVRNKIKVLKRTLKRVKHIGHEKILDILSEIGGHEINGMIGSILAGCECRKPVLIDGFIASSAALAASFIEPKVKDYLIFCTGSTEPGHKYICRYFKSKAILHFGLRLGEGTGVALAWPILKSSVKQLSEITLIKQISSSKPNPEGFKQSWLINE